ncbi:MAG: DNA methyltransferase [Candidatus Zixiibacteriota bacterium]
MSLVGDKSIHLIITSPPYWQLKDYGFKGQIGFDDTYEDYINNLNLVWQECHRVLHDGCRLCINIGDQFARSVYYGRYKVIPIRTEIIRFCETIGFDFMGSIIWQKVTTCNTTGGATIMGSFPYPRNGIVKIDYEFILLFKKHGRPPKVDTRTKQKCKLSQEEWNLYFNGHWNFPGEKQLGHLAMFPEELPRRLIKMFSFVGETVLDPFLGSGTTTLAAMNLERNSIGYEINKDFRKMIASKLKVPDTLFNKVELRFDEDPSQVSKNACDKLPYLFNDPLKFDKKVDPRKLKFGSRVNQDDAKRNDYYQVREIISPTQLRLSNDLTVKLLGVAPVVERENDALDFLRKKVKGKQVLLKYDECKYDEHDNLLVYLYLKNKTFVNAHLIKYGLARAASVGDYKYKSKFTALEKGS